MQTLRCRAAWGALCSLTRTVPAVQHRLASATSSASDDDFTAARAWLAKLHAEAIPLKAIGELTFSRSSGPGGQNVNKYDKPRRIQRRTMLNMSPKSQF